MTGISARRPLPTRVEAALLVTLLAAVLVPAVPSWGTYLVSEDLRLPDAARVVEELSVADALLVRSPVPLPTIADRATPLSWRALPDTVDSGGTRIDSGIATIGARQVWAGGEDGARALVALIDTGVAAVPGLEGAVAGEIDFSGSGSGGDGHGHGTFLASLIAGRGDVAPGVAPGAGVLSLKVAAADGSTSLGSVLSALQWLHGPGQAAGIRVAVLALGVDTDTHAAMMLDTAVSRVARKGVLVVTASGNEGGAALTSPATAPGAVSVGALDDAGTTDASDDVVADFSGAGVDRDGHAEPDLHAPGVSVAGSLPADSVLAASATQIEDLGLYHGSGTSMSTALTAGVAALASSARPDLDGHALAAVLAAGAGRLDAPATFAAAQAAAEGRGAKGGVVSKKGNRSHNGDGGNAEPEGIRWKGIRWKAVQWNGAGWGDAEWYGAPWGGIRWKDGTWGGIRWKDGTWGGIRWKDVGWTGASWTRT